MIDTAQPLTVPFTVLIDHREKRPFRFAGLRADAKQGRRPLTVPTRRVQLQTGDYTVEGLEDRVAVERKSLEDLFGTLAQCRDRFERELIRLARCDFAAVVIEADWLTILASPPERSELRPKSVFRSVLAWQQRHPTVHWWACWNRAFAETVTFRLLERFWKESQKDAEI
ncbi:MAG TPA: ERCC4 domain-containing protein [Gemmataceae bacterium]|nr:ERCC4 domain-containing protein [Gemmataceae bacterium]